MSPDRSRRRGSLLLDTVGGLIVFTIVMGLTVQVLAWAAAERKAASHRVCAILEAQNLIERFRATSFDQLDATARDVPKLGQRTKTFLPDGNVHVTVEPPDGPLGARRVTVIVQWAGRGGTTTGPVRLSTWVHPPAGVGRSE